MATSSFIRNTMINDDDSAAALALALFTPEELAQDMTLDEIDALVDRVARWQARLARQERRSYRHAGKEDK